MTKLLPISTHISTALSVSLYLCFAYTFHYLFHLQAYASMAQSDLPQHLSIINDFINSSYYIPHPMFHITVYCLSLLTGMHIAETAPVVMTAAALITIFTAQKLLTEKSNPLQLLIAASTLFVIAVYLPFYNKHMYIGQFSPNIWHSPTMLLLKPLALAAFYFFVRSFELPENKKRLYLLAGSSLLLLSTMTKPSFVIVFLPATVIYLLLFKRGRNRQYGALSLFAAPSVMMLAYQYLRTYQSSETASYFHDKIIFSFFGVMKLYSPSIIVSTLLVLAFPLSVLFAARKIIADNQYLVLAWLTTLIAFLQAAFLAEQQKFAQGAFCFGYVISLFLLYFFSAKESLSWFSEGNSGISLRAKTTVAFIYLLHLVSGIYYFYILLKGGSYF